ncbi:MAG: LysM peptidoglycan-binding domain-containing protein [Gammaproteobacteria bacterium]|nr:LysM peptidoglycan-binding domain-containing protein [Gammaproteobacteria bacterium]
MQKIILTVIGLLLTCAVEAADVRLRDNHPDSYIVQKGDTLWDISGHFLAEPWAWPEIWEVNPQIENPHLIYPGDRLSLVHVNGQPQLRLERGPRSVRMTPSTDSRLRPEVHREPLGEAISTIPLGAISAFLSRTRIVSPNGFDGTPYVIAGEDRRIVLGAGQRLYARGDFRDALSSYGVFRPGPLYADPFTGEVLGRQALDVGSVDLLQLDQDPNFEEYAVATMGITRTSRDIRLEDRLLAAEDRTIAVLFQPGAPSVPVDGVILGLDEGVTQIAKFDVVAINRGEREGLQPGHVLAVYKRGATVRDRFKRDSVKLPDQRAGLLMVFRSFDKMSLGLVLEADRALSVLDSVRNP